MFSRVPRLIVGLDREITHSLLAVPRRDKSPGDTILNSYLSGFFYCLQKISIRFSIKNVKSNERRISMFPANYLVSIDCTDV
jgi:hypothetical protein